MFSIQDRNILRDHVLQLATSDSRVVAGAFVGSDEVRELATKVEPQLRESTVAWES